jgi:hypothetical protein
MYFDALLVDSILYVLRYFDNVSLVIRLHGYVTTTRFRKDWPIFEMHSESERLLKLIGKIVFFFLSFVCFDLSAVIPFTRVWTEYLCVKPGDL